MRDCPHFSLIAASRKPVLAFKKANCPLSESDYTSANLFSTKFLRKEFNFLLSRGPFELEPVCYVGLSRDWLSCFRFLWTHKTYLRNSYRELFCSFLCTGNVPEVLLWKDRNPIGGDYNCSPDMSRLDMTAVSLNYLKFSHIFLRGYGVARKSALTLKFTKVQLVSSQNKIVREREKKITKNALMYINRWLTPSFLQKVQLFNFCTLPKLFNSSLLAGIVNNTNLSRLFNTLNQSCLRLCKKN